MLENVLNRRDFIKTVAAGSAAVSAGRQACAEQRAGDAVSRWRGVNITEKLNASAKGPFRELDFAWLAEFGFNFARLPMDYRCWTRPDDWSALDEAELREIDDAVAYGRAHGVHVNLNMHRIPGHGVAAQGGDVPVSLWDQGEALDAAALHWRHFAERYKGIPNSAVSFNLLNEPPWDTPADVYEAVARRLIDEIWAVDPGRLIVADGLRVGSLPMPSLADLGVHQSLHWYEPFHLTHWRAPWVSWIDGFEDWPEPGWPLTDARGKRWDLDVMRAELAPWRALPGPASRVSVGEFGVYGKTPHAAALAWLEDCLKLFKEAGWGWALWGFRGHFGILDTARTDVKYEAFRGHRLDRAMLELLQRY